MKSASSKTKVKEIFIVVLLTNIFSCLVGCSGGISWSGNEGVLVPLVTGGVVACPECGHGRDVSA